MAPPHDSKTLSQIFADIRAPRVLVIGDLMLDRYTWGDAERLSQEAPVIVLNADTQDSRLGGAANVCHMLSALGARISVAGFVGTDDAGRELRNLLAAADVVSHCIVADESRPTTCKDRFIGRAAARHPNQILRVDREVRSPLSPDVESKLLDQITAEIGTSDIILISDYAKGVCSERVMSHVIQLARQNNIPVIIDPGRGANFGKYGGATLIKPNRLETEVTTGQTVITTDNALEAGRWLCQRLEIEMALVTLDRQGMVLTKRSGESEVFSTSAKSVYDITGAGDMVLAMLGLCMGAGMEVPHAVRLANIAAGIEVQKSGVAVVSRAEVLAEIDDASPNTESKLISLDQAAALAKQYRQQQRRIVFTNGCFDLLHVGHVTYLAESAQQGDVLFVGVNSDKSVRRLKGPARPIIHENDRVSVLAALAAVSHVIVFDEDTPCRLLEIIRPDVLVKGGTYATNEVVGHEIVASYGGEVYLTHVVDGISTTNILQSLNSNDHNSFDISNKANMRRAG